MAADLHSQYGLNPPHSEVVEACEHISSGAALDMGCSNGRNALYLAQRGFYVTAVDNNANALESLQQIISNEGFKNISPELYDINQASLGAQYDFIACTVTLMFLDPERVDDVLRDMQNSTKPGGYNLIVCAMDTPEHPCPMPFPFTFTPNQLADYYKRWEALKYNENLGTMHNGAQLQFATLLARKPQN